MRPVWACALALVVGATAAQIPAADAAKRKPTRCAKGKARVLVAGHARCVAAGKALPAAPAAQTAGSFLLTSLLQGSFDRVSNVAFPPPAPLKDHVSPAAKPAAALVSRVEPMARIALGPAARGLASRRSLSAQADWTEPQITSSESSSARTTTASASHSEDGATGTIVVTGTIPKHADGELDTSRATLDFSVSLGLEGGGGAAGFGFSGLIADRLRLEDSCPTAAGRLKMTIDDSISWRGFEEGVTTGVEYLRRNTTLSTKGSFHATVDPAALLEKTTFQLAINMEHAVSGSLLNGLIRIATNVKVNARAAGTIDGRSGAVSLSSLTIDGSGTALRESNAAVRKALEDPASRAVFEELVAGYAASAHDRLKKAEEHWREPNECARMTFTPPGSSTLPSGKTKGVQGAIVAAAGGESESLWKKPVLKRGSLASPWAGKSAPKARLRFVARGAGPDKAGVSFRLDARATSRAGIAEGTWKAGSSGWRVTISGPVAATQGACCFLLSSTVSTTVTVVQPRSGVPVYTGRAPLRYTTPAVTVTGSANGCTYAFGGVAGTADITITPTSSGRISVNVSLVDMTEGSLACFGTTLPNGGMLAGGVFLALRANPVLAVAATEETTSQITWATTPPLPPYTGRLTVRIEPL